jgi:hypothetical protein
MPCGIRRSRYYVNTALVLCAALTSALGQQGTANDSLRSPEVDAQGKVTFRLLLRSHAKSRYKPKGATPLPT